ncbi:MAG: cytochrome c oxidase assembly factor Coa1 family protein, partial [Planctomycetota bacterium]
MEEQNTGGWWSDNRRWTIVAGGLIVAALVICGLAYGLLALMKSSDAYKGRPDDHPDPLSTLTLMKSSGAYKVALARVKSHPKVTAALGTPVKEGWFLTGTVNVNGSGENADVSIPLSGPKG